MGQILIAIVRYLDEPTFVMLRFAKLKVASFRVVFDGMFVKANQVMPEITRNN